MGKAERDRGKRGELLLRDVLRAAGWTAAERGQQRAGGVESPDVKNGPRGVHIECKFVERLSPRAALAQARRDAPADAVPVVAWKTARQEWVAVLALDDLLRLLRDIEHARIVGAL